MNEKFNTNAKVEQLTKVVLSHGEEKGLIVRDPLVNVNLAFLLSSSERHILSIFAKGVSVLICLFMDSH